MWALHHPILFLLLYRDVIGLLIQAGLLLATEARMARLRELLAVSPHRAGELADLLFDRVDDPAGRRSALDALVTAGSRITGPDGLTILSARYHLFVRATEGAYTCLSAAGPHVTLARHERCPIGCTQMPRPSDLTVR